MSIFSQQILQCNSIAHNPLNSTAQTIGIGNKKSFHTVDNASAKLLVGEKQLTQTPQT